MFGIKTFVKRGYKNTRFWCDNKIFNPLYYFLQIYLARRIIGYYGADYKWSDEESQNISKNKGNLGYGFLSYGMIRNSKPKRVLCIGSMYGFIPFMCALGCKDNRWGTVDFVDASYNIHDEKDKIRHAFGQGFWKKVDPKKHFSYLGVSSFITTYIIRSNQFAKKYRDRHYDFIFVDGDHTYQGVKSDFEYFWPKLNKYGFMIFHDVQKKAVLEGIKFGYWKLWQELTKKHRSWIIFPNPVSGLGIIQKI